MRLHCPQTCFSFECILNGSAKLWHAGLRQAIVTVLAALSKCCMLFRQQAEFPLHWHLMPLHDILSSMCCTLQEAGQPGIHLRLKNLPMTNTND